MKSNRRRKPHLGGGFTLPALLALLILILTPAHAQADCAEVRIEIIQELTFERQAFDARMVIDNGLSEEISDVRVDISIVDQTGDDRGAEFFLRLDAVAGMVGEPDGFGVVPASTEADIHWLIIPSFGAGGMEPQGQAYDVGATLTYTVGGKTTTIEVVPDTIVVAPMPMLVLDYFEPEYVVGDDPWTPVQEAPVPYTLGVRVQNIGYGPAANLKIESGQPRIVENLQGLLIDFRILATEVGGATVDNSLLAHFGDLNANRAAIARWIMVSTLSGQFVEFEVSFTHDDDLGGELTSLIDSTNAHYLIHDVRVDLPGRDTIRDFLGTIDNNPGSDLMVYESDNVTLPVARYDYEREDDVELVGVPSVAQPAVLLTAGVVLGEAVYLRVEDPMQGTKQLLGATRGDGKAIDVNNVWLAREFIPLGHRWRYTLNLFDIGATGDGYTVVYDMTPAPDTSPPETRIVVADPQAGDPVCVTRDTNLIFVAEDAEGPVFEMYSKIDGAPGEMGDYIPAISPFRFELRPAEPEGPHEIHYWSRDEAGNEEIPKTLPLVLDESPPVVALAFADPEEFSPDASEELGLARTTTLSLTAEDVCGPLDVSAAIALGTGDFDTLPLVRTLSGVADPGLPAGIVWDGRDDGGALVPAGEYTVRLELADPLAAVVEPGEVARHRAFGPPFVVRVVPSRTDERVDPGDGEQTWPDVSGERIVWQDDRDGPWQIYSRALDGGAGVALAATASDQLRPAVSGELVAWSDTRNDAGDVAIHDLSTGLTTVLERPGTQGAVDVDGDLVVFESDEAGAFDVYLYEVGSGATTRLTDHERDQRRPRIGGGLVVWEDGRFGKPEVFSWDLALGFEQRISASTGFDKKTPVVSSEAIVWADQRTGSWDLWVYDRSEQDVSRLTYAAGAGGAGVVAPAIADGYYAAALLHETEGGPDALVTGDPVSCRGERYDESGSSQTNPKIDGRRLVWQDDRDGRWQIYTGELDPVALRLRFEPGYNLVAMPRELVDEHATARALLAAWYADHGVEGLSQLDPATGAYHAVAIAGGVPTGTDFALLPHVAVVAEKAALLQPSVQQVTELERRPLLTLDAGTNGLGVGSYPLGYRASDLVAGLGAGAVVSVQRFDRERGAFDTLALAGLEAVGADFRLRSGEGVFVVLDTPVANWRP